MRYVAILLGLLLALPAFGTCSIVQAPASSISALGTTLNVSVTSVVAGHELLAHTAWCDSPSTFTASISDGQGSYSVAVGRTHEATDGCNFETFYLENANSGTHSVTVTFSGSSGSIGLRVFEIGGTATSSTLDQATGIADAAGPGTGTDNVSSGASSATTNANDCVLGFTTNLVTQAPGGTLVAGTGYSSFDSDLLFQGEIKTVSSTGAQTATFTQSVNYRHGTAVVALKQSTAGAKVQATKGPLGGPTKGPAL